MPDAPTPQAPQLTWLSRVVALTGGIGAGKTEVAKQLASLGAAWVNADQLAREIVQPGARALAELAAAFGADILDANGGLKRGTLAERCFGNAEAEVTLARTLHPRIARLAALRCLHHLRAGAPYVVYEIPLLVETAQAERFHHVVSVSAPASLRIQRVMRRDGLSASDACKRLRAQATEAERIAASDIVIDNTGRGSSALRATCAQLHAVLLARVQDRRASHARHRWRARSGGN